VGAENAGIENAIEVHFCPTFSNAVFSVAQSRIEYLIRTYNIQLLLYTQTWLSWQLLIWFNWLFGIDLRLLFGHSPYSLMVGLYISQDTWRLWYSAKLIKQD